MLIQHKFNILQHENKQHLHLRYVILFKRKLKSASKASLRSSNTPVFHHNFILGKIWKQFCMMYLATHTKKETEGKKQKKIGEYKTFFSCQNPEIYICRARKKDTNPLFLCTAFYFSCSLCMVAYFFFYNSAMSRGN